MPSDYEIVSELLHRIERPDGYEIPCGATTEVILDFENRTSIRLPDDFKLWLSLTNGARVGPGAFAGIKPHDHELDIEYDYELHPEWRTLRWVPVSSDGCGNYYVIVTGQEYGKGFPIVFVDSIQGGDKPAYIVASTFMRFARFALEEEIENDKDNFDFPWPFDEAYMRLHDPEIVNFKGIDLPWQT
ncbi:MAG: SMI1/KNR4 family protein [Planctomycetales bacterium]|nr:SMI1/KNR4 family protein [Planctomycetales bacterium]